MTFLNRLDSLLKSKNLTRKEFLEIMKFGKNQITYWEKHKTLPNASTLNAIATYFGVSVEYLIGLEDEEAQRNRAIGCVVEWLSDNEYEYTEEANNLICICKNGNCVQFDANDFAHECVGIKKAAEDGFGLAMNDWARRHFMVDTLITESKNVINDSPNATMTVHETDLSKQEREIIDIFRGYSLEDQVKFITYALKLKNGEV